MQPLGTLIGNDSDVEPLHVRRGRDRDPRRHDAEDQRVVERVGARAAQGGQDIRAAEREAWQVRGAGGDHGGSYGGNYGGDLDAARRQRICG